MQTLSLSDKLINSGLVMKLSKQALPEPDLLPTLHTRKHEFVRNAIWDAATDLFAEKGFDETTVEDIAEAAGVSRRSFFRYFASKSDLMAHGMVHYKTAVAEVIAACPQDWPVSKVLHHTVLQIAQQSAAHPRTVKLMRIAEKYPAAREAQTARIADVQDYIAEAFAQRMPKRSKDGLTQHLLAGLTVSMLGAIFRSWFEHPQRDIATTVDEAFAALAGLIPGD